MESGPVLALDIASCTGACVGTGADLPDLSHHRLEAMGQDGGRYFHAFRGWLQDMIVLHKPTLIAFEAPVLPRMTSLRTTRALQGLVAHTEEIAHRRSIDCREVNVVDVKRGLTGMGNAKKADMVAVARQYGLDPAVHDEADAFAVWLCAIRQLRPQHAHQWDLIFRRAS